MKIKKIAIVTPWFGDFAGGAEAAARSFAQKLSKCNIEVEVLTTCCKSPYHNWWEDHYKPGSYDNDGYIIKRFKVNKTNKEKYEEAVIKQVSGNDLSLEEKYSFFRYGINSDGLIQYVQEQPLDFPIIALPYFQGLTFSLTTKIPQRISLMPCFHDEPQFCWEPIRDMLLNAKNILYLSDEEKEMTIKNYGLEIGRKVVEGVVVGVGIEDWDTNTFLDKFVTDNKINNTDAKNKYGLPTKYFIYVGRKEAGKGVLDIVNWYPSFFRRAQYTHNINIPMVFIGGGDASLIPNSECFIDLGFVDEKDKYPLISNSEALINLSKNESFSLVIMEAWKCNIPVIVSGDCAVTSGHCLRSNGGLVVKDQEDFSRVLELISNQTELKEKLGNQGSDYVNNQYNWETVISRLLAGVV